MINFAKLLRLLTILMVILLIGIGIVWAASASDTFSDETKMGKGTEKIEVSGGQVKIGQCYSPTPAWQKVADTTVRDISSLLATATVDKDIYCDDNNCLLWTDGAEAPTTVCVATDPNVYGNILWAKADSSAGKTWADSNFSIFGFDIGGTHPSGLKVGNNSSDVSSRNYLERNYSNTQGMFDAMDICKTKGSGWRLPNILELDSIRDQAKGSAPYTRLPNMASNVYWSSSEDSSTNAYNLNFLNGNVTSNNKSVRIYVRCVRAF